MSLDSLYSDIFYCILDYLELDDIARLTSMNRDIRTMCTEYVPMVSEFTLHSLQHRNCLHRSSQPEQCTVVDKFSVEHGYCRTHLTCDHTCYDCGTIRDQLEEEEACVNDDCCYKFVCRLEDGGCVPLQCWSCLSYYDVLTVYKYSGWEDRKDRLCHECVQEHGVTDLFIPCMTFHAGGIRREDHH